jgi:hypothetical protein
LNGDAISDQARGMSGRTMTPRELVAAGGHAALTEHFGPEIVARLLDLERDMAGLFERELPDTDPDQRAWWAGQLAHVIAMDSAWFSALMQPRPGKVARALDDAHKAARALLKAVEELPPAGVFGTHMRLLEIDLPGPAARQALTRELVYRTSGKVDAGLNSRKAAVAELALALAETGDGIRAAGGGKHRADRLVRHVADTFEILTGEAVPVSGTGEGRYPRLVAAVLETAGLHDVSAADAARREAERRRDAAPHSGENARDRAKVSTGQRAKP